MNTNKLTCPVCEKPVDGEHTEYVCGCGDEECDHEKWAAGCWYLDGEEYRCECGVRMTACVDEDNNAWLEEK